LRAEWYIPSQARYAYGDGLAYAKALGLHQTAWLEMDSASATSFEDELRQIRGTPLATERSSAAELAGEILGAWRSGFSTGRHRCWYLAYASLSAETDTWEELLCELARRACPAVGQTGGVSLDDAQFRAGLGSVADASGSLSPAEAVEAFCESVEVDFGGSAGNVAAVRDCFRDAIGRVEELGYLPDRRIPLAERPHVMFRQPELEWQVLLESPALRGSPPDSDSGIVDSAGLELLAMSLVDSWFSPDPEADCAKWFELGFCLGCLQQETFLPERVVGDHAGFLGITLEDGVDWGARSCRDIEARWLRDRAERNVGTLSPADALPLEDLSVESDAEWSRQVQDWIQVAVDASDAEDGGKILRVTALPDSREILLEALHLDIRHTLDMRGSTSDWSLDYPYFCRLIHKLAGDIRKPLGDQGVGALTYSELLDPSGPRPLQKLGDAAVRQRVSRLRTKLAEWQHEGEALLTVPDLREMQGTVRLTGRAIAERWRIELRDLPEPEPLR
jgi:hypothetical protein